MATSKTAVGPDAPNGSTPIDGVLGLYRAHQETRNYIASLSPASAPVYDTGWVDVEVNAGYAAQGGTKPQVRRYGKEVFYRWGFTATGLTGGVGAEVGVVPVGFRPTQTVYTIPTMQRGDITSGRMYFNVNGSIVIHPGATLGAYYVANTSWLLD